MGRGTRTLAEKGVKIWANFPTREREREPVCEGISARLESVSQQKREKPRRSNTAKERGEAGRASERVWNRNYRLLGVRGHAQVWKTSGKSSELDGGVQESAKREKIKENVGAKNEREQEASIWSGGRWEVKTKWKLTLNVIVIISSLFGESFRLGRCLHVLELKISVAVGWDALEVGLFCEDFIYTNVLCFF